MTNTTTDLQARMEAPDLPAPVDLRPWGYAPGYYVIQCVDCPKDMSLYDRMLHCAAKRSWRCEEHAIAARAASVLATEPDAPTDPDEKAVSEILEAYVTGTDGTGYPRALAAYKRIKAGWQS